MGNQRVMARCLLACFCPALIRWKRRKKQRSLGEGGSKVASLRQLFNRVFKAFGRSFLFRLDPLCFSLSSEKKYRMEAQHGWPLRVSSRRKSSAEERVGGVCRRGRFRRGAIICYRATARPKCSSSHEWFLEKLFRRESDGDDESESKREREREREVKVSTAVDWSEDRKKMYFSFSFLCRNFCVQLEMDRVFSFWTFGKIISKYTWKIYRIVINYLNGRLAKNAAEWCLSIREANILEC